ncbi:MAG: methyltransferase [Myxococcota bacterium]
MNPLDLGRGPATDPLSIYRYRDGIYGADLLAAAVAHLDFFSWLEEHSSDKPAICEHFEIHERPADVMLTLFTALGLVERRGEALVLTPLAREHLVRRSPWFIGPYYASLADRATCRDFVEILRTDRVAHWMGVREAKDWHRAMEETEFAGRFTAAMDARGVYLGQALARSVDLGGRARLLDVGGGSGVYACALTRVHPELLATVLDKPPVDGVAAKAIADRGCAERVSVVAADMFVDPWPHDADVHLLSNVLHDWAEPEVRTLLARSFAALRPGGALIVHDAFINAEKDGPLPVAEYSALLMYLTQGKCYSTREYADFLADAGFVGIEYRPTVADRGRMIARRPA